MPKQAITGAIAEKVYEVAEQYGLYDILFPAHEEILTKNEMDIKLRVENFLEERKNSLKNATTKEEKDAIEKSFVLNDEEQAVLSKLNNAFYKKHHIETKSLRLNATGTKAIAKLLEPDKDFDDVNKAIEAINRSLPFL